jgi:uncharacterized protein
MTLSPIKSAILVSVIAASGMMMPGSSHAQSVQISASPDRPVVTFNVNEIVRARPDQATISSGVRTVAATAVEAMAQNAKQMTSLIAAIKAKGVKADDIQTSGISLSPEYDYNNVQPGKSPRFVGYAVSNTVNVTTTKIDTLGTLLDTMVAAGGNQIQGPTFSITDNSALIAKATQQAIKQADTRAQQYAANTGFARARLLTLSEVSSSSRGESEIMVTSVRSSDAAASTPVSPGRLANSVTITAQYVMEK